MTEPDIEKHGENGEEEGVYGLPDAATDIMTDRGFQDLVMKGIDAWKDIKTRELSQRDKELGIMGLRVNWFNWMRLAIVVVVGGLAYAKIIEASAMSSILTLIVGTYFGEHLKK